MTGVSDIADLDFGPEESTAFVFGADSTFGFSVGVGVAAGIGDDEDASDFILEDKFSGLVLAVSVLALDGVSVVIEVAVDDDDDGVRVDVNVTIDVAADDVTGVETTLVSVFSSSFSTSEASAEAANDKILRLLSGLKVKELS